MVIVQKTILTAIPHETISFRCIRSYTDRYYAFIKSPRINSKGLNTSAIFGFVNTLEDLLKKKTLPTLPLHSTQAEKPFATKRV